MINRTMVNWFWVSQGYKYPKGWYRVLCPDGRRRYAKATTQEPDTFFSHPASVQVKVKGIPFTVSGFISSSDKTVGEGRTEGDFLFTPILGRRNTDVFKADGNVGFPEGRA